MWKQPHIVKYLGRDTNIPEATVNMLTDLMDGDLECLINCMTSDIARCFLHHILRALVFLESQVPNPLIHRDIKPGNILFKVLPDQNYLFQLGDFGLCNTTVDAVTRCGTAIFAAPEIYSGGEQTPKVDVWSLFVTVVYVWNVNDFRMKNWSSGDIGSMFSAILEAAKNEFLRPLEKMAIFQPTQRASASQMLRELFNAQEPTPSEPGLPLGEPDQTQQQSAVPLQLSTTLAEKQWEIQPLLGARKRRNQPKSKNTCPRCPFEEEQEEVQRHLHKFQHFPRRKGSETLPSEAVG